ncbi:LysR family transcriptional regulator [Lactobacillus crispatus]|nr:LysR family transcriptional regulator [Lactobacillus crispatus]
MNKLNFELLHIFDVVSRFASFSQASNYLYLDQSTVRKKLDS